MRKPNVQYLSNFATTMIRQLRVPGSMGENPHGACDLYEKYGDAIKAKLLSMNPGTRGKIADLGLAHDGSHKSGEVPMYYVHCDTFLGKYESGRSLVTEIACTTIIAKMYEILRNRALHHPGEVLVVG